MLVGGWLLFHPLSRKMCMLLFLLVCVCVSVYNELERNPPTLTQSLSHTKHHTTTRPRPPPRSSPRARTLRGYLPLLIYAQAHTRTHARTLVRQPQPTNKQDTLVTQYIVRIEHDELLHGCVVCCRCARSVQTIIRFI